MRECTKCGETKPLEEFSPYRRSDPGRRLAQCKACKREQMRADRAANPEKWREYAKRDRIKNAKRVKEAKTRYYRSESYKRYRREWLAKNPEYMSTYLAGYRKAKRWMLIEEKYGLTREQYESMERTQRFACAICLRPLTEVRVHIDHCHETGLVRGLLCQRCNQAIGLLGDDPTAAVRAARYLRR